MLDIVDIKVCSFDLNFLDIYWTISPCYEDVSNYEFVVERSDYEFGPFSPVAYPIVNGNHLRDGTVRGRHSFFEKVFYRVRVRNRSTAEEAVFPTTGAGVKLAAPPDLAALEMARINILRLQEFSGRKLWLFPKLHSGQRCLLCFDQVSQRKVRSRCGSCYDSSWVGGYSAPIEFYGQIMSPDEMVSNSQFGKIETQDSMLLAGNYPELFEGDVIVEAENTRWRVGSRLTKVKKGRSIVRQQVPIHAIPIGDIEYTLPLNVDPQNVVASPARNYSNPQDLESLVPINSMLGVFVR